MEMTLRDRFVGLWKRYFNGAELPICFWYSDDESWRKFLRPAKGHVCLIGQLAEVRKGGTLAVERDSIGCAGGKRHLGFTKEVMPDFEYFLSYGIPGKLEGERYKKTPDIVTEAFKKAHFFEAPARYGVYRRWDTLEEPDRPEIVIFFATPDVVSGLFTLSNFDEVEPNSVITPFGAGCGTIAQYPNLEKDRQRSRSVIGMFDVSARPFVGEMEISFATPMKKFGRMVENMEESFLITGSWAKVARRIEAERRRGK